MMTGVNDLLFSLYFAHNTPYLPMFWNQDQFAALEGPGEKGHMLNARPGSEERYKFTLEALDRSLLILSRQVADPSTTVLYALQPLLAWTSKSLHPSETAVCDQWDRIGSGFRAVHNPRTVGPWRERYAEDVKNLCDKYLIPFVDLNRASGLQTDEHLFVDRIHLTDNGQRRVAEIVADALLELDAGRPEAKGATCAQPRG
jgi:hypothetical protein